MKIKEKTYIFDFLNNQYLHVSSNLKAPNITSLFNPPTETQKSCISSAKLIMFRKSLTILKLGLRD